MVESLVEFDYLRYKDGPDVPVVENPHYFTLIRFLGLISNTSMAIEWTFEDVQAMFEKEELTEYSRNLHLKLLGFLGKRFPPHVTLERNLTKFLDERPIDVSVIFWDKMSFNADNQSEDLDENREDEDLKEVKSEEVDKEGNDSFEPYKEESELSDVQLYNPYRDNEYKNVQSYERLRTIRILLNTCIQESKQLRNIFQGMENYSMKCKNVKPGECFFGLSPPYVGDDQLGHHYWYINPPNDEVIFKLYRESSLTGELTLLSDNSDTLCSTFKTFLNSEGLQEIGQKLEIKYNALVVAEKAKLRKIRQMRSIRNQLESSWGNCAPTDEMLSGGRTKRKAAMNIDYSYSVSENATRRSSRINKNGYDSDSLNYEQSSTFNNVVKDRSDRLALRNAKKQQIEESEKDLDESTEDSSQTYCSKPEINPDPADNDLTNSSQTPVLPPLLNLENKNYTTQSSSFTSNSSTQDNNNNLNSITGSGILLDTQNHHPSHIQSIDLAPKHVSMQFPSGVIPAVPSPSYNFSSSLPAFNLAQVQKMPQLNQISQIPQIHQIPQISQISQISQIPQISHISQVPQITQVAQISQIPSFQTNSTVPNSPLITANGNIPTITNFPNPGTPNIQSEQYNKN
ncbi:hypothetical protein ChUKH1_17880 [Cryptosporidium hominis]|uniref:WHIM1 domain-containing protein n=1 Tax=Cryptosporidium hominis TaxID=237895 RepID=A0ABX5BDW4_CRYHO|nr:hypothetical protein ChTU502y2012_407g0305 [Cryptosporidium hominis]PPA62825.1 hypothetical protein ChUKH1_17880 [Cryptosporidium hominis]PPS95953.1 Uncharacterized protein GY17_00003294 [Cryptosporidium hominis]|eukprot:PPS95953.1 Uncharacterized protein GY17_00003294 [Cryptosporidium hominis]